MSTMSLQSLLGSTLESKGPCRDIHFQPMVADYWAALPMLGVLDV